MTVGIIYDPRKSPTSIASDLISIDLDVMLDETHEWTNDVTTNPVELGSPVADHIQPMPDKLTITGLITDAPIDPAVAAQFPGSVDNGTYSARLQTHFEWLRELVALRAPLIVYTRYKTYTDMALTSVNIPRSQNMGEALQFNMQFTHIRLVSTQTVDVPPGISKKLDKKADGNTQKKTQTPANQGKTTPTDVPPQKQQSALKGLLK